MDLPSFIKPSIVGLAVIISAAILGSSYKNRNAKQHSINVTGLGTTDFTSDELYWSGSFSAKAKDAKDAYRLINEKQQIVKDFFKSKGFKESEIKFGGVEFQKNYKTVRTTTNSAAAAAAAATIDEAAGYSDGGFTKDYNGTYQKSVDVFDGYTATQTVSFNAIKDSVLMKKIEDVYNSTAELVNQSVEFQSNRMQYTYSELPKLKHSLIEAASKDARERALKIVKTAKGDLGELKNASMGVFQITGKGEEVEDSYGGNFDTYHKEKSAKITVRLEFVLDN